MVKAEFIRRPARRQRAAPVLAAAPAVGSGFAPRAHGEAGGLCTVRRLSLAPASGTGVARAPV
jgi:hypothetical protein